MKLYLLSQNVNNGYDTYDSCVVCAVSEDDAKIIHPYSDYVNYGVSLEGNTDFIDDWAHPDNVEVEYLGIADKSQTRGVICSSFNAG